MLRDKSLIPLSHQHQRALALCVRIERAQPIPQANLSAWQAEIEQLFEQEIKIHFSVEEQIIFPAAGTLAELDSLVEELLAEHTALRQTFDDVRTRSITTEDLANLARSLSTHIRKEERQLFEGMQRLMNADDLAILGKRLEDALKEASRACIIPSETTMLKASLTEPVR
jgi:iron-sulfur cluster repair protein YtfE (RIC family)